jgi:hypothetical protein
VKHMWNIRRRGTLGSPHASAREQIILIGAVFSRQDSLLEHFVACLSVLMMIYQLPRLCRQDAVQSCPDFNDAAFKITSTVSRSLPKFESHVFRSRSKTGKRFALVG